MNAGMKAMLSENLKSLRLSTMLKDLENQLRHAKAGSVSYDEFLLNITEAEVQVRKENGRKRRTREAAFPLMKPLEIFNYDAAPELDPRVIKELAPNSPMEIVKAKDAATISARPINGRSISFQICPGEAPRTAAAFRRAGCILDKAGVKLRTTNGNATRVWAIGTRKGDVLRFRGG